MAPFALFARALLAYSVHEHQQGHARCIDVWTQSGSFTVQDNGRGMGLDREGYVESLLGLVVARSSVVQLHGVGLSLIAASSPRLEIQSYRGGCRWWQTFIWGVADGPVQKEPVSARSGTRITLATAPGAADADPAALIAQIDLWRASHPALKITLH